MKECVIVSVLPVKRSRSCSNNAGQVLKEISHRRDMDKALVSFRCIGYTVSMKNPFLLLALALVFLGSPTLVSACPSCRDALATADDKDGTPQSGFSWQGEAVSLSVLFMLAVPFTTVGAFGIALYRLRQPAEIKASETTPGPVPPEAIPS